MAVRQWFRKMAAEMWPIAAGRSLFERGHAFVTLSSVCSGGWAQQLCALWAKGQETIFHLHTGTIGPRGPGRNPEWARPPGIDQRGRGPIREGTQEPRRPENRKGREAGMSLGLFESRSQVTTSRRQLSEAVSVLSLLI